MTAEIIKFRAGDAPAPRPKREKVRHDHPAIGCFLVDVGFLDVYRVVRVTPVFYICQRLQATGTWLTYDSKIARVQPDVFLVVDEADAVQRVATARQIREAASLAKAMTDRQAEEAIRVVLRGEPTHEKSL